MQGLYTQLCNTTLQIEGRLKAYLVVNGLMLHLINFIFSYYWWCVCVSDYASRSWTCVVTLFFYKQLTSYVTQNFNLKVYLVFNMYQRTHVVTFNHFHFLILYYWCLGVQSCVYIQSHSFSHIILLDVSAMYHMDH